MTEPVAEREPYAEGGMPDAFRDPGVDDAPAAGDPVREGVKSSSSMRIAEVLGPAADDAAPAPLRL